VTFSEATQYLFRLRRFGWRPGLHTIERLMEVLGAPQTAFPTIHVAGTNGKGSTSAMIAAMLQAAGHRIGLYTSPHLQSFTERIRIDGQPISEEAVAALTAELQAVCARHFDSAVDVPHPTFFELTTAMGFLYFQRQGVDAAVIEVGLGGRLDATNVLTPRVAAITNIAVEHEEYLGRTLPEIAREKAGILKPGVPAVTGAEGEALAAIREVAAERRAPLTELRASYAWTVRESDIDGQRFDLQGPARRYEGLVLPLAGRHQVENGAIAIAAVELLEGRGLRADESAIRDGLRTTRWPGRLQMIRERPRILLDGAHNPAGIQVVAEFLAERRDSLGRLTVVFGVLRDKNWPAMLGPLLPLADEIILTRPPSDRAADPVAIAASLGSRTVETAPDVAEALRRARSRGGVADTVLVTGSLYTVGAALQALEAASTPQRALPQLGD